MEICYFERNEKAGISIKNVFLILKNRFKRNYSISEYNVPCFRITPINILKNIFYVYRKRNRGAINHITGDIHYCILGLLGCRNILTIHDLGIIDNNTGVKRKIIRFFWYSLPVKLSSSVTCISETTKNRLISEIKCNPNKIYVIYNPINPIYKFTYKPFAKSPNILHIGTRSNKNLFRVIEAIKGIECSLSIIGDLDEKYVASLKKYHIKYKNKSDISNDEMLEEYINCDIVSFPSTYEGFGLPIIEGQAVGRVVLTSHIEPMLEIANNAAYFVDPYNVESIRDGFLNIINNEALRCDLINKGIINVKRFSLSNISNQYSVLYQKIFI
ncbi:glycosyltransferase family 1 protein [uncultured Bacteroides sp.]|uniref:glycosyltransferase family 4 protein n=1 Tax=uncultured Bacteroides sp. TaxID=162156 RepID=UPI002AAB112D|nr:glycosyltransferase family 1 protein [uncultured Bacteroides sp.]